MGVPRDDTGSPGTLSLAAGDAVRIYDTSCNLYHGGSGIFSDGSVGAAKPIVGDEPSHRDELGELLDYAARRKANVCVGQELAPDVHDRG